MITAIHQPNFLPWLGYFHKINNCDTFIILDNVQFSRRMFYHRNKIKSSKGSIWLTVPVHDVYGKTLIKDIKIDKTQKWKIKHLNSIVHNYSKASYFNLYIDDIKNIFNQEWRYLIDLNMKIINWIIEKLEIKVNLVFASDLNCFGRSTELLVNLCLKTGSDIYLSGPSGKNYLTESLFEENGIELIFHNFIHPVYPQLYGDFQPKLSIIDLLLNCGPDSKKILLNK